VKRITMAAVSAVVLAACVTGGPRAERAGKSSDGKPQWAIECVNQDESQPACKAGIGKVCPAGFSISGYTDQVIIINNRPQRRLLYFVCGNRKKPQ
jgi:hypothetical protein